MKTASSHNEPLTGKVEMEELKPCPFCGSNNVELEDISDTDDHQGYVICRNNACGAWPHNAEEIEVAVNQWNSRPIEDIQRERITALESELSRAQERSEEMLELIKLLYRKHHMGDGRIGWVKLGEKMMDALCNAMGDKEYQKWVEEIGREIDAGNFRVITEDTANDK